MAMIHNAPAELTHWRPEGVEIINGQPVRFNDVCVYEFQLSDVEDPEIYVAAPISFWQNSEAGQWVIKHAAQPPYWIKTMNPASYTYQIRIMARLSEHNQTFFQLKWGKQ
jgi:hypothetical protein